MTRRTLVTTVVAALLISSIAQTALAQPGGREAAWFNGHLVTLLVPAVGSSDPNQHTFACFTTGPDITSSGRAASTPIMFVISNPYATQHHCPGDPTAGLHDHVLTTAPGHPGYTSAWHVVFAVPGPNFEPSDMPYTSAQAVQNGVVAGELVLVDGGFDLVGPVVGGAR